MKYKYLKHSVAALLTAAVIMNSTYLSVAAYTTYYKTSETVEITKNTTFEASTRVTDSGLLDVYVLKIPVGDPNISLEVFNSAVEYGLKESTAKLVSDNGGIAGVNGDLFGMNGSYSVPIGTQVIDGAQITSDGVNASGLTIATFFLTNEDSPFIDYMTSSTAFLNNGSEHLNVWAVNRIVDLSYPSIITYEYMTDTSSLDARITGSYKLVVEDGFITYISQKGETVNVPENGYLVVMNEADYNGCSHSFAVGQTAELRFTASVDLNNIKTAISGAGKILSNGQAVAATSDTPTPSSRAPRTAIGINEAGDTVILMAVDGRTHSIGATHAEMAELMMEYGAYNAMELDGGGSTTMVVKEPDEDAVSVVNTLSEGSQRKVINAVGVVNESEVGEVVKLSISAGQDNIGAGVDTALTITGYDEYYNKIDIPYELVNLTLSNDAVKTATGIIAPNTGIVEITAEYNGVTATATLAVFKIDELQPNTSTLSLSNGSSQNIWFTGLSNDGYLIVVPGRAVSYEVYPETLGTVENGMFTAASNESGWIRAYVGSTSTYITVTTSRETQTLDTLDGMTGVSFSSYPATVTGNVKYSNVQYTAGISSVELTYNFLQSDATQAAYIDIAADSSMKTNAASYVIDVFGDNSGAMLRGRLTDANGNQYVVDFTKNLNFSGWQTLTAEVPTEAQTPVVLDRIYVASLSEGTDRTSTIYVDNLRVEVLKGGDISVPSSNKAQDSLYSTSLEGKEGYDITFMGALSYGGDTKPDSYDADRATAIAALANNSTAAIYGGSYDISSETGILTYLHDGSYTAYGVNDLYIIKMFASKGGFASTSAIQWGYLRNSIMQSSSNNIIIHTDLSPLDFTYDVEYQMFKELMDEAVGMGKNIFVVSNSGTSTNTKVVEGVRYINLGSIYNGSTRNSNFSILRFRINNGELTYTLEKVW